MQSRQQLILASAFFGCVVAAGFALLPPELRADLNGDGIVNYDDLKLVVLHLGTRAGQRNFDPRADVNRDGVVDLVDVSAELQLLKREASRYQ